MNDSALTRLLRSRLVFLYAFLFCTGLLCVALYMEHVMMLEPCPLCIMQRIFFLATGLVSLPGMMTGQILAGADPEQAVKYQMLIMFLIAGGTGLGAFSAVIGGVYRLTDTRHRLRLDRLAAGPS